MIHECCEWLPGCCYNDSVVSCCQGVAVMLLRSVFSRVWLYGCLDAAMILECCVANLLLDCYSDARMFLVVAILLLWC